ncbi:MFS transporter [Macrococcus equipercicus]|uniref:MFS transporter n=1 Tax=Macrococcus equipercicus TaxID=69967 RepID=A0A9Q9BVE0_9STAP|nr:MFS transporter [Macrococcus equipercicus]KAA1039381.1 MFS transporter [Macrococcus equipercicus]UTH13673.1 MFS transporter [Macrococcus equipercicus]
MKRYTNNFKYLYFSQLFANTSDNLYIIALIAYLYAMTNSVQTSALIPIFITSAYFLSGFIAPYVYSRFQKQYILVFNQTTKCCLLITLLLTMRFEIQMVYILGLAFLIAFLDGFTNPLSNTLIPYFEKKENILGANTKISSMNNIVQISAWALGSILLTLLHSEGLIITCIIFSIISVIFIMKINFSINTVEKEIAGSKSFKEVIQSNGNSSYSKYLNWNTFLASFGHSVWIAAIMIAFVKDYLNAPSFWFGIINATFFIGLLFGTKIIRKTTSYKILHIYFIGYLVLSIITLLFGINRFLFFAVLLSWLYGVIEQILSITLHTEIQKQLNHELLIDTYTLNQTIYSLGFCISTFAMSSIGDHSNLTVVFIIASLSYLSICLLTYRFRKIF